MPCQKNNVVEQGFSLGEFSELTSIVSLRKPSIQSQPRGTLLLKLGAALIRRYNSPTIPIIDSHK